HSLSLLSLPRPSWSTLFPYTTLFRSSFPAGGDDQHGVVTGDGSGDLREFGRIDGRGQGLRAARRSLQHQEIFCWANVEQKLGERPRKRRERGGLFRQRRGLLVSLLRLHQAKFLQVARKRRLGNAHLLRR